MAKSKYPGVTLVDPDNKASFWQYRIKIKNPEGKTVDTKIRKDIDGKPFMTARAAYEAKMAHEERIKNPPAEVDLEHQIVTLQDVYNNYLETEAKKKAPATLRKQDSMWRNHIFEQFGTRDINSIKTVELDSFLYELYQTHAYMYVEGFWKFFYLLFTHATKMEVLDSERYLRMFVTRATRLKMPEKTQEDYIEEEKGAVVYTDEELRIIESALSTEDGNLLTAFYLGLLCGLRISEAFALRWRDIDFDYNIITISRQLHYEHGRLELTGVKTLRSVRKIFISQKLSDYLWDVRSFQIGFKKKMQESYRDTERVYDTIEKRWLDESERDFVNRKRNGELLTVNSMKYWTKKINPILREHAEQRAALFKLGNCGQYVPVEAKQFQYHSLRHTYATRCAFSNMPVFMLMSLLGHKKIDTTKKYYIGLEDDFTEEKTRELISSIYKMREQ